jgi:hypothetical protein
MLNLRDRSQKWSLISPIRASILLSLRLRAFLRGRLIEIERDIYNGLFHIAFSQSRNNRYDLREKKRSSSSLHYHPVYDNRQKRKFLEGKGFLPRSEGKHDYLDR